MGTRDVLHGDNLALLRELPSSAVDLVYLDPPFFTQKRWTGNAGSFNDRWPSRDVYLAFMRERLVELHRVLRPTGSLYLHADPPIAPYLAIQLDEIFGADHVLGHITWKRNHGSTNGGTRSLASAHDTIHAYHKGDTWTFNSPCNGADPCACSNMWLDCPGPPPKRERVGWPTQKPESLLERIISASSNPGDVVLDPFCGGGTTVAVAKRLGRDWIGMDASADAVAVTTARLLTVPEPLPEAVAQHPVGRADA